VGGEVDPPHVEVAADQDEEPAHHEQRDLEVEGPVEGAQAEAPLRVVETEHQGGFHAALLGCIAPAIDQPQEQPVVLEGDARDHETDEEHGKLRRVGDQVHHPVAQPGDAGGAEEVEIAPVLLGRANWRRAIHEEEAQDVEGVDEAQRHGGDQDHQNQPPIRRDPVELPTDPLACRAGRESRQEWEIRRVSADQPRGVEAEPEQGDGKERKERQPVRARHVSAEDRCLARHGVRRAGGRDVPGRPGQEGDADRGGAPEGEQQVDPPVRSVQEAIADGTEATHLHLAPDSPLAPRVDGGEDPRLRPV
jgi:hypothetical protein